MVTINTEFSLSDPVKVKGANNADIPGVVRSIHYGTWLSQPIQNRFYVLFNTPVNGLIGDWYAAAQLFPNGTTSAGTFVSLFDIGATVVAPTPYDTVINSTCTGIHRGPMFSAAIETTYMLTYNDPQTFGTGRWHYGAELTA